MKMIFTICLALAAAALTLFGLAFLPQWAQAVFALLSLAAALALRFFPFGRR